ncbi:MAG: hypothetical protein ACM31O_13755 [Bacteroidota bacterium]
MDKSAIEELEAGELPTMVSWYDPRLLTRIGIRTIISSVFGQYADQRLVQAATDQVTVEDLCSRYDYSDPYATDQRRRLKMDETGAFWLDYIADTGDGFESTYTMAYLLAKESLTVPSAGELKAGNLLIMGGDQCYPQATRDGYKNRLQKPYGWAYNVAVPDRKLFAIPGNHDWYDGLASFDSLFCAARDKLSGENTNRIGGWQPQQHRSYWAIKLPYNWWIWGADIQFSKYLDSSQVNYFRTIARLMGKEDNLIICLAEPAWMLAEQQGQDEEENFFKITALARESGASIRAVIAGDWHHYAHYYTPDLGVHFLTSGGGGAFMHPTHVLKNQITVRWPERAPSAGETRDVTGALRRGEWTAEHYDIRLKNKRSSGAVAEAVEDYVEPVRRHAGWRGARKQTVKCYPSKARSLLLSLKNLAFPFKNFGFGMGIGLIYWIITWQYFSVVSQYDISSGKIDATGLTESYLTTFARLPLYLMQGVILSIPFALMLGGLFLTLLWYVDAVEKPRWRRWLVKSVVGSVHALVHLVAMFALALAFLSFHNQITPAIEKQVQDLWRTRGERNVVVREVLQETLEPLSQERAERRYKMEGRRGDQAVPGRDRPPPPRTAAEPPASPDAAGRVEYSEVRKFVGLLLYPIEMTLIGGFVGGFIWGFYWVVTGLFGRMHAEDAFAALRIRDYKNFLRFKFEPHQLTIYPLGVDKIPRMGHWVAPPKNKPQPPHNPQLVPTVPIDVRLIDSPIVIAAQAPAEVAADDERVLEKA